MADYIFTQNGDGNVQIGDAAGMKYSVDTALKWALNQNFQSVAAQYARTLALEVVRLREDNERLCSVLQSSKKMAADYEDTGLTPDEIAALRAERDALSANKRPLNEAEIDAAMQYAIDHGLVVETRVMRSVEAERDAAQKRAVAAERDMLHAIKMSPYAICGLFCKNHKPRCGGINCRPEWRGPDAENKEGV